MTTTIQISDNIRMVLERMKMFRRESYNEVIERIIEDDMELSKLTKKELNERIKNPSLISHEKARKRLGF